TRSTLSENIILGNSEIGMTLDECKDCNISQNTISNNKLTEIQLQNSNDVTISNNFVSNGVNGIALYNSARSTLLENMISGNSEIGITLDECIDCNVYKNQVFNNQFIGISLYNSESNSLSDNIISNNGVYGILLDSNTIYIKITRNDFIGNNPLGSSQACDDGTGQNNTFSHNFWDDWTGPDTDSNGIVDEPYIIDGEATNSDLHPQTYNVPLRPDNTFKFSSNIVSGTIILLLILSALIVSIRKQKAR
ncbi:MAG: right-handed parallel beta-helix repeat-containing protein, partial [Candidatus Hodarchaeales archaeon]